MKLRLPHKFQAALMAALASVSFTTLSTGTLTVAAGAALLAGQQAQAEDIVLSNVITVGTTAGTDCTSSVWGGTGGIIASATGKYVISGSSQTHSDTAYTNSFFAPGVNVGKDSGGGTYTYTLTFKTGTFDGPQTLSSISVDFLTYDSGGKAHSDNSCAIKCEWALAPSDSTASGTISSVALPNNDHGGQSTAAYTKKDDGTYTTNSYAGGTANITLSDFQLESDKTYTLTLGVSKAAGPNGFFVGIGNIAFLYTPESFDYTWAATTAGTDWMAANAWTKDGEDATFTANGNATFGSGAASVVGVSSAVVANNVTVSGQSYTFTLSGDGASLTASAITVESGLSITGTGTVTAGSVNASGHTINIGSGATLAATTLTVDDSTTFTLSGAGNMTAGSLSLGSGSALSLGENAHLTISAKPSLSGHNVTLAEGSVLDLSAYSSDVNDIKNIIGNVTGAGTVKINGSGERSFAANQTDTLLTNLEFISSAEFNGTGWQNPAGHTFYLGNGTGVTGGIKVTNDLRLESEMHINVRAGSSLTVGGNLIMGHNTSGNPGHVDVNSGTLSVGHIKFQDDTTENTITLADATVEATQAGNLFANNGNSSTVSATNVTLKSTGVDWAWNRAMAFGGTLAVEAGTHTITLGAAGADFSVGSTITLTSGTVAFAGNWEIGSIPHEGTTTYTGGAVEGTNGFASSTAVVQLVTIASGSIGDVSGAHFTVGGISATLDKVTGIAGTSGEVDYGTFHVMTGSETVSQGRKSGRDPIYSLANGATLVVDADLTNTQLTREAGAAGAATLTGAGTYTLSGTGSLGTGIVLHSTGWTGKVKVTGTVNDLNMVPLGTANSTIVLDNWTGSFSGNQTIASTVEIGSGGASITNGGSSNTITFAGALTGTGNITRTNNNNVNINLAFTGDVSKYTGSIIFDRCNNDFSLNVTFSGSANEINAALKNDVTAAGTFNITFAAADTVVNSVISRNTTSQYTQNRLNVTVNADTTFKKDVTVDNLTIANGRHATFEAASDVKTSSSFGGTVTNKGAMTLAGTVAVTSADLANYEFYKQGETQTYSGSGDYEGSGFLTTDNQYYLVKNVDGGTLTSTATASGEGLTITVDGEGHGLVFSRSTQGTVYYINKALSYNAGQMGSATAISVAQGITFSASGGNLSGKELILAQGATWQSNGATSFESRQLQTLTLHGDAAVTASGGNTGIIGNGFGATTLNMGGHTLSVNGNNHFALFNTTATDAGTIQVNNGGWLQVGHSGRQSSANLHDVVVNITNGGHLTLDKDSTITVEGFSGAGTIQRDGGNGGTITIEADRGSYTFSGSITSTPNLVMSAASTGTQTFNLSGNTTLGTLTVDGGKLAFTGSGTLSTTALAGAGALEVAGTLTVNNGSANEFSGALSLGGLTKSGNGSLTLHGFSKLGSTITLNGGSLTFGEGEYDLSATTATHNAVYSEGDHGYATITDVVQLVNTGSNVSATGATFKYTGGGETVTADTVAADGTVSFAHEQDNTTYYLVNGTSVDLVEEFPKGMTKVVVLNGTGTIEMADTWYLQNLDVRDNATANITSTGAYALILNGETTLGANAHVNVDSSAVLNLAHADTAAAVLKAATGAGNIDLDVNATLGNGTTTAATGKLTIADGKTLTLGGGDSNNVNISSFSQVVLNGGNIIVDSTASTIQGLTVGTGKSGVFLVNDLNAETYQLAGVTRADGNLTVANNWNAQVQVAALVGAGTFSVSGNNGDTVSLQRDAQQKLVLTINSLSSGSDSFTGDLVISHNTTAASDNLDTFTINTGDRAVTFRSMTVDFNQARATAPLALNLGADATMTGAMTLTSGNVAVTGAHTLTVGGLTGSGALTVADALTINVAGDGNYTYGGLQSLGGKLTKSGAGAQTLTVGTAQNPFLLNEAIDLTGGTLTLGGHITLRDGAFEPTEEGSVKYYDLAGTVHDRGEGSGYEAASGDVTVVAVSEDAHLNVGDATFTYMGKVVNVDNNGIFSQTGDPDYERYYIFTDTVSLNAIQEKSTTMGETLTSVYLNEGGTLTGDSATQLPTLHVVATDATDDAATLAGSGTTAVATVTGEGTLSVEGTVNVDALNIESGKTLTFAGSGNINVTNLASPGTIGIAEGAQVNATGNITLTEGHITTTGAGTLKMQNLHVNGSDAVATLGSVNDLHQITMGAGTVNLNGNTTMERFVLSLNDAASTMNIGAGATVHVTGTTLSVNNGDASFMVSNYSKTNTLNIAGTLIAEAGISSRDGRAEVNVQSGGTLELHKGLLYTSNSNGAVNINVQDGGTLLTAGNETDGTAKGLHVNLGDGSTLQGYYGNADSISIAQALTFTGTTTGATIDVASGKTVTLATAISGSGKMSVDGGGTLKLGANIPNGFGSIDLKNGTLQVSGTNGTNFHDVAVADGSTVELIGKDNQDYRLRYTLAGGTLTSSGSNTGGGSVQNDRITLTKSSTISGTANFYMLGGSYGVTSLDLGGFTLTKEGTNTVSLINTDVSTGSIVVKAGTLDFYHRNGTADSRVQADIELNGGTISGIYNYTASDSAVTRNLTVTQSAVTNATIGIGNNVTLAANVASGMTLTMSGAITGNGGLSKAGEGTLELTGAVSYNGNTAVNQGTLALGSSLTTTGDVTVAAGAGITFANGATISANSMTLTNGAKLDFSDYKGAVGSEIHVVTTTAGVTGYSGAAITDPVAPRGMTATVAQKENDIVLTFQAKGDATMHLYVLTGQSNSLGAVKDSPLNATMLAAYQSEGLLWNGNMNKDSGVRFETDPTWQIVAPQKPDGSGYNNNPCMGPEYGFSYIMQNKGWTELLGENDTLAVVKGSLDGGGNGYWLQNANAYQSLLGSVKESIQDAVALGYSNISLDGLMYLQGESNSANEASQAATRFTDFVGYLKSDLQSWLTENPELTGITLSFDGNTVTGEPRLGSDARQTTEGQFLELATSEGMLNADKNGKGHVLTNDLAVTNCDGQNVHYTGNSQLTIGARYAYAFAVQKGIDVGAVRGQDDSKTLDQAGAWWMEKLPGENEVATWDISSVSTVNNIADGATLTVGGIKIDEVYRNGATDKGQGSIAINGGAISLGAGGINLVGGDLSITSGVTVRESQTWQAAEGHKLAVNSTTIDTGATLTMKDGLYLTFGAITGTGNLEIGTVTFDMDLDYMLANGLGKYRTSTEEVAENGFFMGGLDLVKLTGETSAITFTNGGGVENITTAGDLADYTLQLSDDKKALQLLGLHLDEETYFTRKGEVTYTSDDAAQYGIYTAKQVMLSGSVDQPATLKLASALKEGVTIQASGLGGTVNIVDGVTLAAASVNAAGGPVALAGEGTFALSANTIALPTNVTLADAANWHGTVKIANTSGTAGYDIKLNALGNENSAVEFENVTAYLNTASTTYTPNIRLTGEGLNIDAGSTDGVYTFNGDVTGSGTLKLSLSRSSNNHTYVFAGDVEDWDGELLAPTDGKTLTVKFTGKADTVNAAIKKTGGTLNLVADADTTFNAGLTGLNSLTVNGSKSASVLGGIGTNATTLNAGASLTIGGTANSTLGTVTLNNNTALTIGGSGTVTASRLAVADQSASSLTLAQNLSVEQLDTMACKTFDIKSAEGGEPKTITVTGQMDLANTDTEIALQNVNMVVTGSATAGEIGARTHNHSIMTVGANASLNLGGTVNWNNGDKYVDLVVKDGGEVSVTGGTENKLRNVDLGTGGTDASLSFGAETHTAIANTNVAANAHATVNGDADAVDFGNVNVGEGATFNVKELGEAATVSVSDVTIGAGATMGAYQGAELSALQEADLVIASGKTLTAAGEGATLNANLVMEAGSKLDVSGTGGAGLIMGSTVTLNQGNLLTVGGSTDVDSYLRSYFGGDTTKLYTLYSGEVGDPIELYIGDQKMDAITFDAWNKPFMDASSIYSNLQEKTYYLVYNPDHNNVGMVAIGFVPEPTTSTLSLLALCALAARRRRKG